jgi:RNA polymerase sigma-32 factor
MSGSGRGKQRDDGPVPAAAVLGADGGAPGDDTDEAGGEASASDGAELEPGESDLVEPDLAELDADVEVGSLSLPIRARDAGRSALSTTDPLAAYMRDVQRYPVLSAEEQHALAVRYATTGDVDAARRLVTANLRLVVKIAYDYRRAYKNILDLVQEGNIGLMQAVRKYDPYRGVKLSSYAAWWIRAYILRFILNNWRLVKIGTTQAQRKLFFNLNKEKARLASMGIEATPELLAEKLSVSKEDVEMMGRRLAGGDVSLDAPVSHEEGKTTSRLETLRSGAGGVDDVLADAELGELLQAKVHEFGATLTGKDAVIFRERLVAEEPKTLQQLGQDFGVSRERVRQLEQRIQQKLQRYLREQLGDEVLDARSEG